MKTTTSILLCLGLLTASISAGISTEETSPDISASEENQISIETETRAATVPTFLPLDKLENNPVTTSSSLYDPLQTTNETLKQLTLNLPEQQQSLNSTGKVEELVIITTGVPSLKKTTSLMNHSFIESSETVDSLRNSSAEQNEESFDSNVLSTKIAESNISSTDGTDLETITNIPTEYREQTTEIADTTTTDFQISTGQTNSEREETNISNSTETVETIQPPRYIDNSNNETDVPETNTSVTSREFEGEQLTTMIFSTKDTQPSNNTTIQASKTGSTDSPSLITGTNEEVLTTITTQWKEQTSTDTTNTNPFIFNEVLGNIAENPSTYSSTTLQQNANKTENVNDLLESGVTNEIVVSSPATVSLKDDWEMPVESDENKLSILCELSSHCARNEICVHFQASCECVSFSSVNNNMSRCEKDESTFVNTKLLVPEEISVTTDITFRSGNTFRKLNSLSKRELTACVATVIIKPAVEVVEWFQSFYDHQFRQLIAASLTNQMKQADQGNETITSQHVIYVAPSPVQIQNMTYISFLVRNPTNITHEVFLRKEVIVASLKKEKQYLDDQLQVNSSSVMGGIPSAVLYYGHSNQLLASLNSLMILGLLTALGGAVIGAFLALALNKCRTKQQTSRYRSQPYLYPRSPGDGHNLASDDQCQHDEKEERRDTNL